MNLKVTGTNVSEVADAAGVKTPVYIATLEPVGGGVPVRITGAAGSAASTMIYGETYSLNRV